MRPVRDSRHRGALRAVTEAGTGRNETRSSMTTVLDQPEHERDGVVPSGVYNWRAKLYALVQRDPGPVISGTWLSGSDCHEYAPVRIEDGEHGVEFICAVCGDSLAATQQLPAGQSA